MYLTVKERLIEFIKALNISQRAFEKAVGFSNGYVNNIRRSIQPDKIARIAQHFPELNTGWLLTGEGEMLRLDSYSRPSNLIPFYDDVASIGGRSGQQADMTAVSQPTDYIDAGDWFRDATAAIRHYGDSMTEYPQGCILALKELKDRELIVPGQDYVIETDEYRLTKRIQKSATPGHITLYSTNAETYPDGKLIHEPFDIPLGLVRRLYSVLGYVVKKGEGVMAYSTK